MNRERGRWCWMLLLVGSVAFGQAKPKVVVPVFELSAAISESPAPDEMPFGPQPITLRELTKRLDQCAKDADVKAVVFLASGGLELAQVEEFRQALQRVQTAGKKVVAHADSFSFGQYLQLCGAQTLAVAATGDVQIQGLYGEGMFIRGMLDKIKVTPEFMTCGDYKAAGEMFTNTKPSPQAAENMNWLLDGMFSNVVSLIAQGRKVDEAKAKSWIDTGLYTAERAQKAGVIDQVASRTEVLEALKKELGGEVKFDRKYGKKKQPTIDLSSPFGVFKFYADLLSEGTKPKKSTKDQVAIVYVDGPIMTGSGDADPIFGGSSGAFSTPIRKALEEAAEDKAIKAVVLRVSSPGGSATASDIILTATKKVQSAKPFTVSMGGVAASGGYYVSCGAETIFADPSTITGSIGVVLGKLSTQKAWESIGVGFHPYPRGANSGLFRSADLFTTDQKTLLQTYMDDVYGTFKNHVLAGRKGKLKKDLDSIAGGRVYTGKQALDLGLVDQIGTLDDAIAHVAGKASITDYEVTVLPKPKNFFELLMKDLMDKEEDSPRIRMGLTAELKMLLQLAGQVDPTTATSLKRALMHLQSLQSESILMSAPEINIRLN